MARTLGCGLELMGGGLVVLLSVLSCTWATALGATSYKLRGEKLNYKSVAKEIRKPRFFGS